MKTIKRGEVWYADLGDGKGCEQRGVRPVLIIQNDIGNEHSPTVIVASITDAKKRYMPTHVHINPSGYIKKHSVVMLEQVRTIDKNRIGNKATTVSKDVMKQVDSKIKISFGITEGNDLIAESNRQDKSLQHHG